MTRRIATFSFIAVGAAAIGATAFFTPATVAQSSVSTSGAMGACVLRGNLTVELRMDPGAGPASADWASPIKRVDEVSLLDEWAILRKKEGLSVGTLVIPRERIIWINIGE